MHLIGSFPERCLFPAEYVSYRRAMTQPYGPPNEPNPPQYGQPPAQFEQPQYGAPGQQPYGQPGGRYSAVANAYGEPVGSGAKFGVVGATLAGIGAVLLVIAFTAVQWFSAFGIGSGTFPDVHDGLDAGSSQAAGVADSYFSWLAWLLAIVAVVVAIVANLPSPASGPLRALGAVIAAAAIAISFFAIKLGTTGAYTDYLKHARLGFYFAVAGFLLVGIGALIGPKRRV